MTDYFEWGNKAGRFCDFSEDRLYRYALAIIWEPSIPPQMFIGLNPSTADERRDDPTIRRCIGFAKAWGCGGLVMANACAYRSTDPAAMLNFSGDKVGPKNTVRYLERIAALCAGRPIAAWGTKARLVSVTGGNREDELRVLMGPLDCLRKTKEGCPEHPLYLPKSLKPIPWNYTEAR